ncbi:AzlC family ABC transporter permease [Haloplanus halobius]|uniref:AzlC family ABC transporter permease n=1 Tax=Haloplanus halobius TaxID=2934938 RepID=UPI00200E894D|nr:AzlC family ABC transporter permease [Haloplanus sp. XH21]
MDATESDDSTTDDLSFSIEGVWDGLVTCLPVALGVAGYGVVFGVLAHRAGLSVAEAALMSGTVLAGAAQLVAIELWDTPVPIAAVVLTTLVVNLRYVLMGAALRPWFRQLSARQAYASVFFITDENWALTVRELRNGSRHGAFLLGSGLTIWVVWVGATVTGVVAGDAIGDPARYGLDFVLTAVFLTIAVGLWEGQSSLAPWGVAAAVAVAGAHWLPGRWYILLGGLAACLAEVGQRGR